MTKKQHKHTEDPDTGMIDRLNSKESFKVPEGYFKNFPDMIANQATAGASVKPLKGIVKQILSHPWAMSAAAAVVGALIVGTVLITNQNGSNPNPKSKATVATDTQNVESHSKAKNKNSYATGEKENATQNQQKNNTDTPSSALASNNDSPTSPATATDTSKKTSPAQASQKAQKQEQGDRYAQNDKQETMHKPLEAIYDHQYTGGTKQQKMATASAKVIETISFFEDTCIDKPTEFTLPQPPEGYQMRWIDFPPRQKSIVIKEEGEYSAVLLHNESDTIKTYSFHTQYLPQPDVNLKRIIKGCINKNIKIDPHFYGEQYEFAWSDGVKSPVNFVNSPSPTSKTYQLEITGCKTYTYQSTVIFEVCDLTIPNVITPNGDGKNDYFVIKGLENYPGSELIILDRNGKKVYISDNYQNDFDGAGLPRGSYYYILVVNSNNQTIKKGNLNIVY
ncbi:MAG: gliding motility-associated C-terminal domain-containing protein [Bacteroidales bacterium]